VLSHAGGNIIAGIDATFQNLPANDGVIKFSPDWKRARFPVYNDLIEFPAETFESNPVFSTSPENVFQNELKVDYKSGFVHKMFNDYDKFIMFKSIQLGHMHEIIKVPSKFPDFYPKETSKRTKGTRNQQYASYLVSASFPVRLESNNLPSNQFFYGMTLARRYDSKEGSYKTLVFFSDESAVGAYNDVELHTEMNAKQLVRLGEEYYKKSLIIKDFEGNFKLVHVSAEFIKKNENAQQTLTQHYKVRRSRDDPIYVESITNIGGSEGIDISDSDGA
jgi:hypothetical protein